MNNMNKKILCLFAMTLLNFSSINAMEENQPLIKYLLDVKNLNYENTKPYKKIYDLCSEFYQLKLEKNESKKEQLNEYFNKLLNDNKSLKEISKDESLSILKSNIKLVQDYIKNNWVLNKSIPSEINNLFDEYNKYCDGNMTKDEAIKIHEAMKKKYKIDNRLWMLPHRIEGDIYFIYHPDVDKKEKEKEWRDSKSKKVTNRFGEVFKSGDGLFAIEIGGLFSFVSNDIQHINSGRLSILNSKLRLLIVWKQNYKNELIESPTLYLTKHYKDPINVNKLNLD